MGWEKMVFLAAFCKGGVGGADSSSVVNDFFPWPEAAVFVLK
jgi:hypothetical protein